MVSNDEQHVRIDDLPNNIQLQEDIQFDVMSHLDSMPQLYKEQYEHVHLIFAKQSKCSNSNIFKENIHTRKEISCAIAFFALSSAANNR